jgi:hypothetical protein
VLATADLQLSAQIDLKLSDLLAAQREGQLSAEGQSELRRLMLLYQEHLLRKAIAVREAVKRGLREPMGL